MRQTSEFIQGKEKTVPQSKFKRLVAGKVKFVFGMQLNIRSVQGLQSQGIQLNSSCHSDKAGLSRSIGRRARALGRVVCGSLFGWLAFLWGQHEERKECRTPELLHTVLCATDEALGEHLWQKPKKALSTSLPE